MVFFSNFRLPSEPCLLPPKETIYEKKKKISAHSARYSSNHWDKEMNTHTQTHTHTEQQMK